MKTTVLVLSALAALSTSAFAEQAQPTAIEMVSIKGGEYMMGSPDQEFERQKDEVQHKVKVNDFMIARYEVSQALYRDVMGSNPSAHSGNNCPLKIIPGLMPFASAMP